MEKKTIAFVCVHNSCRSQMAEALAKLYIGDKFNIYSAGTEKVDKINQDAVRLIKKLYNIDMEKTQYSKLITDIPKIDILITMGCNVSCPFVPHTYHEDWGLEDPTGKNDEEFIKIIDKIDENVKRLMKRY